MTNGYDYGQHVRFVCEEDFGLEAPATTLLNRNDVGVVVAPSMIQNEVVVKFRNHINHFSCPVGWIESVLHSSELDATTEILWDEEQPTHQPWLGPDDGDLGVGSRVAYLGHWEWYRGDMVPKDIIHTGTATSTSFLLIF